MKVNGLSSLKKHWKERRAAITAGLERGLMLGGLVIQAASQKQTPVDTGALRNSHRTTKGKGGGRDAKGRFTPGSGGAKAAPIVVKVSCQTAYAIFVHERLDLRHAEGTNAKFLENAARQNRRVVYQLVKQEIDRG